MKCEVIPLDFIFSNAKFLMNEFSKENGAEILSGEFLAFKKGCEFLDKFSEFYPCYKCVTQIEENGDVLIDISYEAGMIDMKIINIVVYVLMTYENDVTFKATRTDESDTVSLRFKGILEVSHE